MAASVRRLLWTWLPTAFGASMLVAEIPLVYAAVARAAHGERELAAIGICVAILVVVNTPALAMTPLVVTEEGRRPHAQLRRYAMAVGGAGSVALLALGGLPPMSAALRLLLGVDDGLVDSVRLGLLGLAANSFWVAMRRYLHGRLIHAGRTRAITVATFLRIGGSAAAAWAGVAAFPAHGALVGGMALSMGALSETAMLALATRALPPVPAPPDGAGGLLRRHWQLAAARLLNMAPPLLTTVAVAHSAQPAASLTVWPALYELAALFTSPTADWESVAATALRRERHDPAPRRLTAWLAAGFFGLFAAVLLTAAADAYLRVLLAVPDHPADLGLRWAPLLLPMPVLWLLRAYLRGAIMAAGSTGWLVRASGAHLAALAALAAVLSLSPLPGVAVAGLAILAGLLADIAVAGRAVRTQRGATPAEPVSSGTPG